MDSNIKRNLADRNYSHNLKRMWLWVPIFSMAITLIICVTLGLGLSGMAQAETIAEALPPKKPSETIEISPSERQDFQKFFANLIARHYQSGLSQTAKDLMKQAEPIARVIELDRRQPEFTLAFGAYFQKLVNKERIEEGRRLAKTHQILLSQLQQIYQIPSEVLMSFWALETNYGQNLGEMNLPNALATLAWEGRRRTFFSREFNALLDMMEHDGLTLTDAKGSWAGAMGQMQFMPTTTQRYGVDGDHDGKINLRRSLPDAFTSAANFLHELGWHEGELWGEEVSLPPPFDYSLADGQTLRPRREWLAMNIRLYPKIAPERVALSIDDEAKASLLLPSGANGPAFLLYHNYRVILGWNQSSFYGLAVGILSDAIAGRSGLVLLPPSDEQGLSRRQVQALQQFLIQQGNNDLGMDGIMGPATRQALRQWQNSHQKIADGYANQQKLQEWGVINP